MEVSREIKIEEVPAEKKSDPTEAMSGALLSLSRYLETLKNYQVVKDADLESLADLITRAKGPYRSMRQFAEDVGVSPATMSRVMNQKTAGPLNNELLAKIAANADKQSGVTLEMLLAANGEAKKGVTTSEKIREDETRRTILDELVRRGYTVSATWNGTVRKGPGFMMGFDCEINTDAVGKGDGKHGKWLFEFKSAMSSVIDQQHPRVGTGRFRQWLTMVMSLYYCGMADADMISYVTDRREIFEQAKEVLRGVRIPDGISLLYIQRFQIAEEYVVSTTNDDARSIFFGMDRNLKSRKSVETEEMDWDMDAFGDGGSQSNNPVE